MHVMAAHMAHRNGVPFGVLRRDLASVFKAGVFRDGECIHVGAKHHGRTIAVAEKPDHTCSAYTRRYLEAGFPESVGRDSSRSSFLHRQLGMGVDVLIESFKSGQQSTHATQHARSSSRLDMLCHDGSLLDSELKLEWRERDNHRDCGP